jgi:small conductance mechanosensitive channel
MNLTAALTAAADEPWYVWLYHSALLQVLVILAITVVMQIVLNITISRLVRRISARVRRTQDDRRPGRPDDTADLTAALLASRGEQRAESVGQLLRSAGTFIIWTIAFITILSEFNIDIAPLLASAGVVSVALAFGAQTLVKDYLSGIAMIVEDQFGVGDMVDLGPVVGTVEEVTLRVTRLRDGSGVVWYVRNGEVMRVANRSQGWTMAVVDFPVGYDEDLARVQQIVNNVGADMDADPAYDAMLLSTPSYAGVESVTGQAVVIKVVAKAAPDQQIPATRAIRARVKTAFDREGVRVPVTGPEGFGGPVA